jgi:hypothetical protein
LTLNLRNFLISRVIINSPIHQSHKVHFQPNLIRELNHSLGA